MSCCSWRFTSLVHHHLAVSTHKSDRYSNIIEREKTWLAQNQTWPTESSSKCFFHQMPVTKLVCLFMYVKNVVKVGMVEIMMDKTGIQTRAPSSSTNWAIWCRYSDSSDHHSTIRKFTSIGSSNKISKWLISYKNIFIKTSIFNVSSKRDVGQNFLVLMNLAWIKVYKILTSTL